jgi:hypothetical protein
VNTPSIQPLKELWDHTCCMHFCRSIKDVNRKSDQFYLLKIFLEDEIIKLVEK